MQVAVYVLKYSLVRLLTYNIHKGIGGRDRRYDLDRVMGVIAEESPDLLCLQEVTQHAPRTRRDDQPHLLAEAAGAAARHFQLNVRWREGGYGNLILSKWPVAEHEPIVLGLEGRKPRGGQVAVVEAPEGRFLLANWHLGLGEFERHRQAGHFLSHPTFRKWDALPALLAGDANDWRNFLARRHLAKQGFHHATRPWHRFRSYPAFLPMGSLDKVFIRGGIAVESVRTVRTPLARAASDHLPVVVDFALKPVQSLAQAS